MTTNYEQQANDFLNKTNTSIKIEFLKYGSHFPGEKECRNIYKVKIKRENKSFSFNFWQSIYATSKGEKPTNYDILSCLQKYDVGSFDDFCSEFGYDEDSRKAEKTYNAVCKEYDNVCKIWSEEEIELLQEIN